MKRESGSAHGTVARAGPAGLRTARLATVLDEGLDRAGRDVGNGILRPLLPMRLDVGRHQTRNQQLEVANVATRVYDRVGLCLVFYCV